MILITEMSFYGFYVRENKFLCERELVSM